MLRKSVKMLNYKIYWISMQIRIVIMVKQFQMLMSWLLKQVWVTPGKWKSTKMASFQVVMLLNVLMRKKEV